MSRAIEEVVCQRVEIGLECFLATASNELHGARIGLLCNQASVNSDLELAVDLFASRFGEQLTALFTPQHGLWGEQQANMIETPHAVHPRLGLPIHSLYSETRQPTPEMLESIDVLVVDLPGSCVHWWSVIRTRELLCVPPTFVRPLTNGRIKRAADYRSMC